MTFKPFKLLRKLFWLLLILLIIIGLALTWVLATESGARFALSQAEEQVPELSIQGVSGSLLGSLTIEQLSFTDDKEITHLENVSYSLALGDIWSRVITITSLNVGRVVLPEACNPEVDEATPNNEPVPDITLALPLTIHLKQLTVGEVISGKQTLAKNIAANVSVMRSNAENAPSKLSGEIAVHTMQYDIKASIPTLQLMLEDQKFINTQGKINLLLADKAKLNTQADIDLSSRDDGQLNIKLHSNTKLGKGVANKLQGNYELNSDAQFSLANLALAFSNTTLHSDTIRLKTGGNVQLPHAADEPTTFKTNTHIQRLIVGNIVKDMPGKLNFDLGLTGKLPSNGKNPQFNIDVSKLNGTLRDHPINGGITLATDTRHINFKQVLLDIAGSVIKAQGTVALPKEAANVLGKSPVAIDLAFNVDANIVDLSHFVNEAQGALRIKGTLKGDQFKPIAKASIQGNKIALKEAGKTTLSIAKFAGEVDIDVREGKHSTIVGNVEQLVSGTTLVKRLTLEASGTPRQHTATLKAELDQLTLSSKLEGGQINTPNLPFRWQGIIPTLDINAEGIGQLGLLRPAVLQFTKHQQQLERACLGGDIQGTKQRLCATVSAQNDKTQAQIDIEQFQALLLSRFAEGIPEIDGVFNGKATIDSNTNDGTIAKFDLQSASGKLRSESDAVAYRNFVIDGDYKNDKAKLQFNTLLDKGKLNGVIQLLQLTEDTPSIEGEIIATMPSLKFLSVFVPDVQKISGDANAKINLTGSLAAPNMAVKIAADIKQATVVSLGIKPQDIKLRLNSSDAKTLKLNAKLKLNNNRLDVSGKIKPFADSGLEAKFNVQGKELGLVQTPDLRMWLSPKLDLSWKSNKLKVGGKVDIERGKLLLKTTEGVVGESSDIVIIDAPENEQEEREVPLDIDANVIVNFVEPLLLEGQGLDGQLSGSIGAIMKPRQSGLGNGELELTGTYTGYGQNLLIKRGRVMYSNTPLDNPSLDILAVRQVEQYDASSNIRTDDLEAGLTITGTAEKPVIKLYANQAMDEGDILAYLLLGKPADQLSEGEGGGLAEVATQLGLAGGDKISRWLGNRFGIDRVYIKGSSSNAKVVVGKRISKKLYVNFQRAIFKPINELHINYKLGKNCSADAVSGEEQGMDIRCSFDSK